MVKKQSEWNRAFRRRDTIASNSDPSSECKEKGKNNLCQEVILFFKRDIIIMTQEANTPQFIKQAPWYAQTNAIASTSKVSKEGEKKQVQEWYDRGKKGHQASTFRKGAC